MAFFEEYTLEDTTYFGAIHAIEDWQDVLTYYRQLTNQVAPQKILFILDDISQCEYTSMHASHSEALHFDDADYFIIDGKDVTAEQEEIIYNQIMPLRIAHYQQQLLKAENQKDIIDIKQKTKFYNDEDYRAILAMNDCPLPMLDIDNSSAPSTETTDEIIEKRVVLVKQAKVSEHSLKIALMPNGYFQSDFNIFENYFLIASLNKFGYEFMGIGASWLYFIKNDSCSIAGLKVCEFLQQVYGYTVEQTKALINMINDNNYLILPYSESPSEYFS